jgi:hypothetical protein
MGRHGLGRRAGEVQLALFSSRLFSSRCRLANEAIDKQRQKPVPDNLRGAGAQVPVHGAAAEHLAQRLTMSGRPISGTASTVRSPTPCTRTAAGSETNFQRCTPV